MKNELIELVQAWQFLISTQLRRLAVQLHNDVNKDLRYKAKDSNKLALKAKAKDQSFKAKNKAKDIEMTLTKQK